MTPTGPPTEEQTRERWQTLEGEGPSREVRTSRRLAASGRDTVSAPAAPGRQENLQVEAEASPEGEVAKPKRQPADRRQCRAGGPGSGPTTREHNGENQ